MPRQHSNPIGVPRSPYSPPLKTWSSLGWEQGPAIPHHPALVSLASPRRTTYSSSESTLCASQQRLSEILELQVSPKTITLRSPFELKETCVHSRDCDYSSFLHSHACTSPLLTSMLSSRPVSLHSSDILPTDSFGLRRLSRSSTRHGHDPTGHNVHANASTAIHSESRDMLIFPPSQFSARLRKLAPSPLRLSPIQHPATRRRRPFANDAGELSASLLEIPLTPAAHEESPIHATKEHRPPVTALEFPDETSTSFSSFEILQWRRRVSRTFKPSLHQDLVVMTVVSPSAPVSPIEPGPRSSSSDDSNYTRFDEPPTAPASEDTSVANSPPPPGRTRLISLPPIPYVCSSGEGEALLSPLIQDLRTALAVSSLILQAERCAEAVGDAAMVSAVAEGYV